MYNFIKCVRCGCAYPDEMACPGCVAQEAILMSTRLEQKMRELTTISSEHIAAYHEWINNKRF